MKNALTLFMVILIPLSSGCAMIRVVSRPAKKDLSVLILGTPRNQVIAGLGNPDYALEENGKGVDLYHFRKGLGGWAKFSRAIMHLGLDVLTVGLWEIIASPVENILANKTVRLKIVYDSDNRVEFYTDWGNVKAPADPEQLKRLKQLKPKHFGN